MISPPAAGTRPHAFAPPAPGLLLAGVPLELEGAEVRPFDAEVGVGITLDTLALWSQECRAPREDVESIEHALAWVCAAVHSFDAATDGPWEAHFAARLQALRDRVGAVTARLTDSRPPELA